MRRGKEYQVNLEVEIVVACGADSVRWWQLAEAGNAGCWRMMTIYGNSRVEVRDVGFVAKMGSYRQAQHGWQTERLLERR